MKPEVYLRKFQEELEGMLSTTQKKNADYGTSKDAFANFRAIEQHTNGLVTMKVGIVTRMSDKFSRICNLLNKDMTTGNDGETMADNLKDLAVYAIILKIITDDETRERKTHMNGVANG